ncbi:SRPBCC family protein [Myxosarcina sp. GI1(2024)]
MREQIKLNVFYPHSPPKVWQALTDCRILNAWMMKNDFKPRLGHKFRFESNCLPGIKTIIRCEVVELDEPKRLAYTWQDEVKSQPSLVIWTLTPVKGGTQLQLKHLLTGYATTVVRNDIESSNLFLYQETELNCDRQISQISLRQRMIRDKPNFPLDYRDSQAEWNYRLEYKLPQDHRRYNFRDCLLNKD